jgi:tetratricopeptide (TPR) repeat protein
LHPDSPVPFDLAAFNKQIGYALSRDDAEWAGRELAQIEAVADRYLEAGNLTHAGALYHLILEETLTRFESWWLEWDEDGDVLGVLSGCAEGLDACLEQVDDPETRLPWLEVLLQADLQDTRLGGTDFAWPAGDVVLRQATDEEWTRIEARVRQEMQRASSTWAREVLVRFLAARLDATGQEAEANAFVLENGTPRQRAFLLLDLGRVEEAVEVAHQHFASLPGLVIDFANAMADTGHSAVAAAYVAEQARHGRYSAHYHPWLARHFEEDGDQAAALELWHRRFKESPGFETYQELRRLGGELGTWESLRPTLLEALDPVRQASLLLNIALDEGDVAWALGIVSHPEALFTPEALIRVAQAAEADYPRAALEIYRSRAERAIATRGRASYQIAAEHLLRVRALHRRLSEEAAWNTYITHLREDHRRLRALREELDIAGL